MKLLAQTLAVLSLLALAGLAGIVGVSHAVAAAEPERALAVDPNQSDALLALAEKRRLAGLASPADLANLGARLIQSAPALDAPLVYAGLNFAAKQDGKAARRAFEAVVRRQPRNVIAQSWLAADDIRSGQNAAAISRLEHLASVDPERTSFYAEVMADMARTQSGARALELHFAKPTRLAEQALARLNATSSDIPLLLKLNAHSPRGQAGLIDRLHRERGATQAFIAWLEFAPSLATGGMEWPIDPAFVGDKALLPFNWRLQEGAELLEQGGLFARYNGRASPVFARQVVLLGPGNYVFKAAMDGRARPDGGAFEWILTCETSHLSLGAVDTRSLNEAISTFSFPFTIPPDGSCPAQQLEFRGRPGDFPERTTAIVRRVEIVEAARVNE